MDQLLILAYLLITLGLALMAGELFFPTGGLLFLASTLSIIAGIAMTFLYGDTFIGFLTLLGVFVALPVVGVMMVYLWPRTPIGRRLMQPGIDQDATVANMPVNLELEQLRGKYGRAVSDLRPSGVAEFEGRRIDVLTEGMLVPVGAWLRCIDVRAGRVIVRVTDKPDVRDLEAADFN